LDFIEELNGAAEAIRKAPERWPFGSNHTRRFMLWRFPFTIIYSHKEDVVTIWPSLMEAVVPNIGRSGCDV